MLRLRSYSLLVLFCALTIPAYSAETLLDQGYRQMYDLKFENAHASFQEWQRIHPDDPVGPASDAAAYLFAEFDRLQILKAEFFNTDEAFLHMHELHPDAS